MANKKKQKRRLGKSLARRRKEIKRYMIELERYKTDNALRNIFVKSGILKD
ncbi:DUF3983 domain-containing protein [Cytobacillus solani]|uniref:DUF3983 domain-containing protein n=1 Tax=Cytobacillus solani TaxID=1637975 RepID=UPI00207A6B32|nr:DUF3983 domain-containing protein [Cytobacillus solani]USK56545.1 DUF3983 domain-containing protein [Cytobacillus solani]